MKKHLAFVLCCILLLTGCGSSQSTDGTIPPVAPEFPADTTAPVTDTDLIAVSVPADTERFSLEDGTELFSYTCQHMQLILPDEDVADKVILDFLNRVDSAGAEAESILTTAQNDYDPSDAWFPYFLNVIYSPMRIDQGVLSLFGTQNSYFGGMHGSLSCVAANYDLMTGDVLTLGSIMHMDATPEDFITIVLDKLAEKEEEYYLYEDYEDGVRSRLGSDENLYEDFYFTQTGLNFFFSPYEIAPYSSGIISVEIPYSELPGLIYDGYFPAERETVDGKMQTGLFMDTDMEQFSNMAEVNLTTGQQILVAYPSGTVEDIRITIPGDDMAMPAYTVFAALEMSDRDAVVVSLSEQETQGLTLQYYSSGDVITIPFTK